MDATTTTDTAYLAIIDDLEARIRELESAASGMLNAWVMFTSGMPGAKDEIVTALEDLRLALTQDELDEEA